MAPRLPIPHLAAIAWLIAAGCASASDGPAPAPSQTPAKPQAPKVPGVTLDRQARTLDIEAEVCLREGDWLELLACAKGTKEHEAVLAVHAKPSDVHLALLLIGLEPGSPIRVERKGDDITVHEPRGPRVGVWLRYEKDGAAVEVPAHEWIVNQKTKKPLEDNVWLFAGSRFEMARIPTRPLAEDPDKQTFEEKEVYSADYNGAIFSLVNFGDDVLTRRTKMDNRSDDATWGVNTAAVPRLGTKVIIRVKALDAPPKDHEAQAKPNDPTPRGDAPSKE